MNRIFGGILVAIGILVAGASGLCSVLLIATSAPTMTSTDFAQGLPIVLIVGGIPFLIGLAAIWGGRKLMQANGGDGPPAPPPAEGDAP